MKKVYTDNREIAHLWMAEAQDEARNPRNNFYFDGDTIYSYGHYFPIARIARNNEGVKAVLFTTDSYSPTTSGHITDVRMALDSSPVFHIENPGRYNPKELFDSYLKRVDRTIDSIKPRMRPETKSRIFGRVCEIVDEANRFMWPGDLLRFDAEANEIETSRGARVPVEHTRLAYRFVSGLKASGKAWKRNGHTFHVGHYALDSVDLKGNIVAGCHSIKWSEILHLAVKMGLAGTAAE